VPDLVENFQNPEFPALYAVYVGDFANCNGFASTLQAYKLLTASGCIVNVFIRQSMGDAD